MAKIKSYPNASPVVGTDKWIGSDSQNKFATKNFTADSVAAYINIAGKVEGQSPDHQCDKIRTGGREFSGSGNPNPFQVDA